MTVPVLGGRQSNGESQPYTCSPALGWVGRGGRVPGAEGTDCAKSQARPSLSMLEKPQVPPRVTGECVAREEAREVASDHTEPEAGFTTYDWQHEGSQGVPPASGSQLIKSPC